MHRRTFLSATSVLAASVGLGGGEARASTPPARTLSVFNSVSIDGFFTDEANDMSWAHSQDAEWAKFMSTNASGEAELVFGRKTYEMMARFWPSKEAAQAMPDVARGMNRMRKTVFSHTLKAAEWENSRLAPADLATEIRRMKSEAGPNLLILGSGEIVAQLTQAGLIDAYQLVVVPIVLGSGRTLFEGVTGKPRLELTKTRAFENGNVVGWYERL
jgi:dihydrofolate reductase